MSSSNVTTPAVYDVTSDSYVSTANKVIEVTILIGIIVTSVLGNGSLWIVVLRSRALRSLTSMFILGLSMAGKLYHVTGFIWVLSSHLTDMVNCSEFVVDLCCLNATFYLIPFDHVTDLWSTCANSYKMEILKSQSVHVRIQHQHWSTWTFQIQYYPLTTTLYVLLTTRYVSIQGHSFHHCP